MKRRSLIFGILAGLFGSRSAAGIGSDMERVESLDLANELISDAAHQLKISAKNWREIAAQENRNSTYYRGLLCQIAESLNDQRVYVSDDGSIQDDVLVDKLPELLLTHRKEQREENLMLGAGWMHADCCADEKTGVKPTEKELAGVPDRLIRDINNQ